MIQEERLKTFFTELEAGEFELTKELIENHDFLHCFFATTRAAMRARRHEKVQLFARALVNGIYGGKASSIDEFEESLSIIDELSFREWQALSLFDRYYAASAASESPMGRVLSFWSSYCDEVASQLSVPRDEVTEFVHRTARTGVFKRLVGFFDDTGEHGVTTPTFARLKLLVERHASADP